MVDPDPPEPPGVSVIVSRPEAPGENRLEWRVSPGLSARAMPGG